MHAIVRCRDAFAVSESRGDQLTPCSIVQLASGGFLIGIRFLPLPVLRLCEPKLYDQAAWCRRLPEFDEELLTRRLLR